jgi:uncharacterized protein (TIGR03083 family)
MSEISRHLPLSQRTPEPEAKVTAVWSEEIADVLDRTADLLASLDAEGWEAASMCEGWTVRDVAGHIVWRVGASNAAMVRTAAGSMRRRPHLNPMRVMDDLSADEAARSPEELVARIRAIAAGKRAGTGRKRLPELLEVVVHAFDIAHALRADLELDARSTGAVAVARAAIAPASIRGVLRARTLRASDAGWSVGHGPVIEATASTLIMYLFGRTPRPEGDAAPAPAEPAGDDA